MSDYEVIAQVSRTLQRLLWEEFRTDPVIQGFVPTEQSIVFHNPTQTAQDNSNRLSLWLYQITENEFLKNQPMQSGSAPDSQRFPPIALNLFYLVTPFGPSGEADHLILGKTLGTLYDNATVLLNNPAAGVAEELRIILCRMTLEETTRIWEALREPYRLSVCYQVRVMRIDSRREPGGARVLERDSGFTDRLLGEAA